MNKRDFLNKSLIQQFIKLSSVLILLLFIITYFLYNSKNHSDLENLRNTETNKLKLQVNEIINDLVFIKKDLQILSDLVATTDGFNCSHGKTFATLKKEISLFSTHKELYDQIRILNTEGKELLKCKYNNGVPIFLNDTLLEDKSDRYYFNEIKKLGKGDIYFSKFDLNVENGVIEEPYKQVLRIGCKITNCKGESTGVLFINYLGKDLVTRTKELNTNNTSRIHVLDPNGYFLISPNSDDNWGFMFNDKKDKTYANFYPMAWDVINKKQSGQLLAPKGLFTFNKLDFKYLIKQTNVDGINYFATDDHWNIVSFVPIKAIKEENLSAFYLPVVIIIILIILLSYFLSYYKNKNLKSEEEIFKLASVVKSSANNIIITDINGVIEWTNDAFIKYYDLSPHNIIGEKINNIILDDKTPLDQKNRFLEAITSKSNTKLEVVKTTTENEKLWINLNIKFIHLGKRKSQNKFIFIGTDITNIKNKEQEVINLNNQLEKKVLQRTQKLEITNKELIEHREKLKLSKKRIENAFSTGGYAWWEWNYKTDEIIYSSLFYKMIGYKQEEITKSIGWFLRQIHTDDVENVSNNIKKHINGLSALYDLSFRFRKKDGNYIWFNHKGKIEITDKNNQPIKLTGTLQDITIVKNAEEEITKAKNAAEDANKAKSDFLANMSHEIRTPMNVIIGFSEQLSNSLKNKKQLSQINLIRSSSKNLLRIINDILDLSKIEAGKIEIDPVPVSLKNLGTHIQRVFEQTSSKKDITFTTSFHKNITETVVIDEVRIRQVLFNLASNAVKFTEKGAVQINFKTQPNKGNIDLTIQVKDSGIGIPKDQLKYIFDPFIQSRGQSVIKYGGTGLGLSISNKLVETMNGTLSVESKENKGSTFTVFIPNIPFSEENITVEENAFDTSTIIFNKAKILVVDDTSENRDLIIDLLETSPDIGIIEASNGKEAIELATKELPDLILMDLRMPIMNGLEATTILKKSGKTKHIPIIAITASIKNNQEIDKLKNIFEEYIIKPLDISYFFTVLSKRLDHTINPLVNKQNKASKSELILEEDKTKIPEFIKILETEFLPDFKTLVEQQVVNEIEDCGSRLLIVSKKHQIKTFIKYSENICEYADNFEFDKLMTELKKFPQLIDEFKKQLEN